MFAYIGHSGPSPPLNHGITRERSLSVESAIAEEVVTSLDPTTAEVAEMLFSLREGKRSRNAFESSQGTSRQDEDEAPLNPEERSSSSSGSACSTPSKVPCKALTSTSNSRQLVPLTTRSYVWRGPKRSLLNPKLANACPVQLLSSDPDEDEDVDHAVGRAPAAPACAPAAIAASPAAPGVAERSDRDKEWAALTTWLRMNLHQPRTAKREVLFIGSQSEERGWRFFLNPALAWDDVSLETKMRLRTLPQETELAFMRKYPGKPGRDWVKKTQKYRPPGGSVTFAVPLADMVYSLTSIYYRFEGRPGTGTSASAARLAAQSCADAAIGSATPLTPAAAV